MKEVSQKIIRLLIGKNKSAVITAILFLLFTTIGLAQSEYSISGQTLHQLNQAPPNFTPSKIILTTNKHIPSTDFSFLEKPLMPTIPKVYAYEDLAFFCKIEVKLEQASKMPVKFRLGTVDYVDKLEGKR